MVAGIFATIIFISAILTWRVVRYVNLVGAIRYLWALSWATPFETYAVVHLFDYFGCTRVWIKHWWADWTMAWFRKRTCQPPSTYNTLCVVPISDNETAWCLLNYNATNCSAIRNNAQATTDAALKSFYFFSAVWGLLLLLLVSGVFVLRVRSERSTLISTLLQILLAIDTLEHIITKPLVQRSRQWNIALWLSLPIVGCLALGVVLTLANGSPTGELFSEESEFSWVGPAYIAVAGKHPKLAIPPLASLSHLLVRPVSFRGITWLVHIKLLDRKNQ